jgi:hypothetical protein
MHCLVTGGLKYSSPMNEWAMRQADGPCKRLEMLLGEAAPWEKETEGEARDPGSSGLPARPSLEQGEGGGGSGGGCGVT